jgi:hypothetical protein
MLLFAGMRSGAATTAAMGIGATGAGGGGPGSGAGSKSTNWTSRQRGDAAGRTEIPDGVEPVGVGFGPAAEEIRGSDIETNFRFDLPSLHYSALCNREMQADRQIVAEQGV